MDEDSQQRKLFKFVILRAICDALGFTNENKSTQTHRDAVDGAREWFYENSEDFQMICENAGFDNERVKKGVIHLIEARQSGDHSSIPDYWRKAFVSNRMPSFTAYAEEIDKQLKRG